MRTCIIVMWFRRPLPGRCTRDARTRDRYARHHARRHPASILGASKNLKSFSNRGLTPLSLLVFSFSPTFDILLNITKSTQPFGLRRPSTTHFLLRPAENRTNFHRLTVDCINQS